MTFGESVFMPEAEDFVKAFLDKGFTEIDTAYVYNDGVCEKILGEIIKKTDRPFKVSTKVNPRITGRLDGEAAVMQLNASLERLGVACVDTLYLHFPDPATPVDSVLKACAVLHEQGKFKELGLSNFPAWMVADVWYKCKNNGWVLPTVYEGIYNPLTRRAEEELNVALDHFGMRFYAYNPMAGGLLTGRYGKFEDAPEDGRFTHRPNYKNRYWKKSYFEAVELLQTACAEADITLIEAVYRWLANHSMLKNERGDAIIIGASKLSHLEQNMAAAEAGELPESIVEAFEKAWSLCKADSPAYFTLYNGMKK